MINIQIKTIPYKDQRYDTCGDWFDVGEKDYIRVNEMPDRRAEMLIAIHELIEMFLCQVEGIPEPVVLKFDLDHDESDDPGTIPEAPYHRQHMIAETVERLLCLESGLNWEDYDKMVTESFKK